MTDENKNEIIVEAKTDATTEAKTMSENYETLKATAEAMTSDFEKFNSKKIKAAGQRVRSHLLIIKKLCDTLRKQIIADINDIPIKHRIEDEVFETAPEVAPVVEPVVKVRKPRRANKKKPSDKKPNLLKT